MLDPVKVDTPVFFPHACVQCRGATGPLVDTHVETAGSLRVYVCASCVAANARALGMAAGDEQAALLQAVEHDTETQKKLGRVTKQRARLLEDITGKDKTIGELAVQLEWADGRIKQLEALIRSDAEASLAVVKA